MSNKNKLFFILMLLGITTTFVTHASTPATKEYVDDQFAVIQAEIDAIYNA